MLLGFAVAIWCYVIISCASFVHFLSMSHQLSDTFTRKHLHHNWDWMSLLLNYFCLSFQLKKWQTFPLETPTKARRFSCSAVLSATQSRRAASTRLVPTWMDSLAARQAKPQASPTQMPTRTKVWIVLSNIPNTSAIFVDLLKHHTVNALSVGPRSLSDKNWEGPICCPPVYRELRKNQCRPDKTVILNALTDHTI